MDFLFLCPKKKCWVLPILTSDLFKVQFRLRWSTITDPDPWRIKYSDGHIWEHVHIHLDFVLQKAKTTLQYTSGGLAGHIHALFLYEQPEWGEHLAFPSWMGPFDERPMKERCDAYDGFLVFLIRFSVLPIPSSDLSPCAQHRNIARGSIFCSCADGLSSCILYLSNYTYSYNIQHYWRKTCLRVHTSHQYQKFKNLKKQPYATKELIFLHHIIRTIILLIYQKTMYFLFLWRVYHK